MSDRNGKQFNYRLEKAPLVEFGYSRRRVHWKHVQKFPDREAAAHAMKTLELQNPEFCYRVVKA